MQLTVRDASSLLKLPEKRLFQLIKRNEIPHYRVSDSFYFNKAELLEWAISRSVDISSEFFNGSSDGSAEQLPSFADSLESGGIHRLIGDLSKAQAFESIVQLIPGIGKSASSLLFRGLMAREAIGSTAIGNGIAIPHVRNPIILNIKKPSILLCFLEKPIDFGALDGELVSTIFTMISPTARIHLHLLARLSFFLQNNELRSLLALSQGPEALSWIREAENKVISAQPPAQQGR